MVDVTPAPPLPAGRSPGRRRDKRADLIAAWAMIAPSLTGFAVFVIGPTVVGVVLSFFAWDLFSPPRFVGLENFQRLFGDADMLNALVNTLQYLVLGVVPTIVLGFLVAVFLNVQMRGVGVLRTLYFVPLVVSAAVSSILWAWIYQPQSGILNRLLAVVGIDGPAWLSDRTWALPALTIMLIWMSTPIVVILYLAALQRIPDFLYDAAKLDGAGPWTRVWHIMWPNVQTTTVLVLLLQILNFTAAPFEVALIMTDGGPLGSTESLSLYIYKVAFAQGEVGYASALSILQFVVIGLAVVVLRGARGLLSRRSP